MGSTLYNLLLERLVNYKTFVVVREVVLAYLNLLDLQVDAERASQISRFFI